MVVVYRTKSKAAPDYSKRADMPTPMIMQPIKEYHSPIDGRLITSRHERDDDCRRNDAIPWEPGIGKKAGAKDRTPGKYRNPNFAKKRGLPLSEQVLDTYKENS